MSEAASFDAIMQCNLLEIFCEALGGALFITDKRDEVSFASVRLQHLFPIPDEAIRPGKRARDLYSALFDAGCRMGVADQYKPVIHRDEWIAERVAIAWRERVDTIEAAGPGRWLRMVSRRFPSGIGLTIFLDVSEHKKKETAWRLDKERIRLTEEILDTLPVAVAVKDRDLRFAAVNQKFCAMVGKTADMLLGHDMGSMFDPQMATALEAEDRALLKNGTETQTIVSAIREDGSQQTVLNRARRIGRADLPYIVMSFEDMPIAPSNSEDRAARTDIVILRRPPGESATGEILHGQPKPHQKMVYVCLSDPAPASIPGLVGDDVEMCVVRSEAELTALLPALQAAGHDIDLVVIDPGVEGRYAAIAARHSIASKTLDVSVSAWQAGAVSDNEAGVPEAGTGMGTGMGIVVVEDNPINQMVVEQIFGSLGLDFVLASSAQDALAKIDALRPALIFADFTLPDLPFDAFCRSVAMLYVDQPAQPAVIAMLSDCQQMNGKDGHEPEITDAIMKPLSPEAIDRMVRKHGLETFRTRRDMARTAA